MQYLKWEFELLHMPMFFNLKKKHLKTPLLPAHLFSLKEEGLDAAESNHEAINTKS